MAGTGKSRHRPNYSQTIAAILAMVAIFGVVVSQFSPLLGLVFVLFALTTLGGVVLARRRDLHVLHGQLTTVLMLVLTVALAVSVISVILQLANKALPNEWSPSPPALLGIAAAIWIFNVLLFAFWYWELDAGGPAARHNNLPYRSGDLVFPQRQRDGDDEWTPEFLDYLFFAFNSSTAFSPTDTLVLSRRMKLLMMVQALVSLAVLAVIASRAVNALVGT